MNNQNSIDLIIARAKELISQIPIGTDFDWRGLFGDEEWEEIGRARRPQTAGDILAKAFCENADPVIEFVRVGRNPRRSVFRKIREVGRGDHA